MKTENPIAVANALVYSLKEIQLDGQTVSTFLERIGIVMEKVKKREEKIEDKTEEKKDLPETIIEKEPTEAEHIEDKSTSIEEIYVKVPLRVLLNYYYLKGYLDGERKNEILNEQEWQELENLYEKDKLEVK